MDKSIFEGAKFGDNFLTRDGRVAILISLSDIAVLAVEIIKPGYMRFLQIECDLNGNINNRYIPNSYDIVSRYQEPIDEEELNNIAIHTCSNERIYERTYYVDDVGECVPLDCLEKCFKAGYYYKNHGNNEE